MFFLLSLFNARPIEFGRINRWIPIYIFLDHEKVRHTGIPVYAYLHRYSMEKFLFVDTSYILVYVFEGGMTINEQTPKREKGKKKFASLA